MYGDEIRGIFKSAMWVSLILFEIIVIVLSNNLSDLMRGHEAAVLVLGIIIGTVLNGIIHLFWACLSEMFEDIAYNAAVNEKILSALERQRMESAGDETHGKPNVQPTYGEKRIRSISERMSESDSPEKKTWTCPACGTVNPSNTTFCKDCGRYK